MKRDSGWRWGNLPKERVYVDVGAGTKPEYLILNSYYYNNILNSYEEDTLVPRIRSQSRKALAKLSIETKNFYKDFLVNAGEVQGYKLIKTIESTSLPLEFPGGTFLIFKKN